MRKRGFTLIELIIVLAIISFSFLILNFKFSVIDNIGAQNEIKTFLNDYTYARDMALSTGNNVVINFKCNDYEIVNQFTYRDEEYNKIKYKNIVNRDLKYVECLKDSVIEFKETGYVYVNNREYDFSLVFVSKKDSQKKWDFTIQAVGGYIYENK